MLVRTWVLPAGAVLLGLAFAVSLQVPSLTASGATVTSNGGQLLAAVLAAAGCAVAARRCGRFGDAARRRAWLWLSVGTGAWAAGQTVWSYYEVAAGHAVPFPSLADVGFLAFPLAAAVGLVTWLGVQGNELAARGRDVLDGAIIAGSLVVLSWVTSLGSVVAMGADSTTAFVLSAAYPVGDLLLGTLVLIALARGGVGERATLLVLAAGLGGLAVSDSAYVYLVAQRSYSSADVVSSGWVLGFLLVGAAGLTVRGSAAARTGRHAAAPAVAATPVLRLVLPYVPLVTAGVVLAVTLLDRPRAPVVDLLLGIALVAMVLTRQFLAVVDNQRLVQELAVAHDQLQHQALHDALTGLANRVLFADRLEQALLRDQSDTGVLYCDLDDFKNVNDELGHDAGDAVLAVVAERLLSCVRATDTVARLGGDEFAVLLGDGADAARVAERVVAVMHEPIEVAGRLVPASMSVGISRHRSVAAPVPDRRGTDGDRRTPDAGELAATAARILREADSAMYAAKGAGKDRAVAAEVRRPGRDLRLVEPSRSAG